MRFHTTADEHKTLRRYYKWHSRIYDATRWSFLFGRKAIVDRLAAQLNPRQILEAGCGTGNNLALLANRFPEAHLTGVDISAHMLNVARRKLGHNRRITLLNQPYPLTQSGRPKYDVILFAYALSVFNPGWEAAITAAIEDLAPEGMLAVVDFHRSPFKAFQRWMGINHVRMEGHLLPFLKTHTENPAYEVRRAYGGLWEYVVFTGRKPAG